MLGADARPLEFITLVSPAGAQIASRARRLRERHLTFTQSAAFYDKLYAARGLGRLAILDFHYLVASKTGVERLFERHEIGLFEQSAYRTAFEAAGLTFETPNLPEIAFGRALYAGRHRPERRTVDATGPKR